MAGAVPLRLAGRFRLLKRPTLVPLPSTPRPERRNCHGRLVHALETLAPGSKAVDTSFLPWASAMYLGTTHRVALSMSDDAAAAFLALDLNTLDFALPRDLIADVAVDATTNDGPGRVLVALSVLTIEAR